MDWNDVAKKAEGLQTLGSFAKALRIGRGTAVLYLHRMRVAGFVRTMRGAKGRRLYDISPVRLREIGSAGLFETLNEGSPLKLRTPFAHRVYGRTMTPEEAVVRAVETGDYRVILVSLELFRKVRDFGLLYNLAKGKGIARKIGALYALSRRYFRVRRMDGRIMRRMKASPAGKTGKGYIIEGMKSSDFGDIEKEWGIRIPFNKSDLAKLGGAA